ncbi:MAG: ATP-binding protein [Methylophilus sp.]|nr:ATP-binding protein [Methylophilus sp.]
MTKYFKSSIANRLFLALCVAFCLVGVVIQSFQYWQFEVQVKSNADLQLKIIADSLNESIRGISDIEQVRVSVDVLTKFNNAMLERAKQNEYELFIQVQDHHGHQINTSDAMFKKLDSELVRHPSKGMVIRLNVDGKPLRVYSAQSKQWQITIAQRELKYSSFSNIWNDLLIYLLIAFPLILIPILWAISRGLQPLKILTSHIEHRVSSDLSPINIHFTQSELKPIVTSINLLFEKLKHKLAQEKAFVHDAAHELQTPLANILTQAHLLSTETDETSRTELLKNVSQSIGRISHLIRQLLQLDMLDTEISGGRENVDVARLARECLMQRHAEAGNKSIELVLNAPDALVVNIPPHALFTILDNLVGNALRYIPQNGLVQIDLNVIDQVLVMNVADNGSGISDEDKNFIFNRFYRGRGQKVSGAGLGLAIVKQATTLLGGSIRLGVGLQERGCCFTVSIPV